MPMLAQNVLICIIFSFLLFALAKLRPCELGEDSYGQWLSFQEVNSSVESYSEFASHFYGGGPGESVNFTKQWIPNNCAYHRFNNASIYKSIMYLLNSKNVMRPLHITFIGDSATRGVYCGLIRILSGSEIYGPCEARACSLAAASRHLHQPFYDSFGDYLTLSFIYGKGFYMKHMDWVVESTIHTKPYAVVVNTGAWDFDEVARVMLQNETATVECTTEETKAIEEHKRASQWINDTMWEYGALAKKLGVRAIYRTNHHNKRFGTECADGKLLQMITGSGWEICDNARISEKVWINQTWDGFHFDRHKVNSFNHHVMHRSMLLELQAEAPGQLEMQIVQTLLQRLFFDALQHVAANNISDFDVA